MKFTLDKTKVNAFGSNYLLKSICPLFFFIALIIQGIGFFIDIQLN